MCYVRLHFDSRTLLLSSRADTQHISLLHCSTVYITIYSYLRLGWWWGGGETAQAKPGMEYPTACKYLNHVCSTQNGESCVQHTKWNPHSLQSAKITGSLITKSDSRFYVHSRTDHEGPVEERYNFTLSLTSALD